VARTALRALAALAAHPANHALLLEHPGLVARVQRTASAGDAQAAEARAVLAALCVSGSWDADDATQGAAGPDGAFVQSVVTLELAVGGGRGDWGFSIFFFFFFFFFYYLVARGVLLFGRVDFPCLGLLIR
jgi:hypothetical protein